MLAEMGGDDLALLVWWIESQSSELKGRPPLPLPVLHLPSDLCRQKRPAGAQREAAAAEPAEGPCRRTWHSLTLCSCCRVFLCCTGSCAVCKERRSCVGLFGVLAQNCCMGGRTVAPNDERG